MTDKEQWYSKKELSAGKKRLKLTWWIYNHFGTAPIKFIAFFITLGTIIINKDIQKYSKKYFKYLYEYTDNLNYNPSFLNTFKHALNYSNSLIDKMLAYSDNYTNLNFADKETENQITELIKNRQGAFFITNHIGNINMLRSFIISEQVPNLKINVFLQAKQCEIFNNFVNSISHQEEFIQLHPVENININTSIEIQEKIKTGEFVFMAGDRVSAGSKETSYQTYLLGHKISLPLGVLKFALMLDCPIFTTTCAKEKNGYTMSVKEFILSGSKDEQLNLLKKEYSKSLEETTLKYPYQFFHFYDIFED